MRTDPAFAEASLQTFAEKLPPWTGLIVMIACRDRRSGGAASRGDWSSRKRSAARLPANAAVLIALVAATCALRFRSAPC